LTEPSATEINNTHKLLGRMSKNGFIVQLSRPHATLEQMWAVKTRPAIKPLELANYEHERMCADVYVSFYLTGQLQEWEVNSAKHRLIEEDRKSVFLDRQIYWEIDRGTERRGAIKSKADRYVKLSGRFHVIFVAPHEDRANAILNELPTNRGGQFLVTLYEYIKRDPLSEAYVSANRASEFQFLEDIPI
jgi:hypothetical protein